MISAIDAYKSMKETSKLIDLLHKLGFVTELVVSQIVQEKMKKVVNMITEKMEQISESSIKCKNFKYYNLYVSQMNIRLEKINTLFREVNNKQHIERMDQINSFIDEFIKQIESGIIEII